MRIENLKQHPFNTTLLGVLQGVLDHYNIKLSPAMTFGGSGHAFLINIHDELCPSGPYCWNYDRFYELVRNLGLEMVDLGFFHAGSTPEERAAVENRLKGFLDQGLPCAVNNMENQLITGYDDKRFFATQPWPTFTDLTPATLTFGTWEELKDQLHVTFWTFRKLAAPDQATVIRAGLERAVAFFRSPEQFSRDRYGLGPKAYDNWAKAAEKHGSSHGNWWDAMVWSECRAMAADFFSEIAARFPGPAAAPALNLSKAYQTISDLLARISDKKMDAKEKMNVIAELRTREEAAINQVDEFRGLFAGLAPGH